MFRSLTPRQLVFDVVLAALCVLVRLAIGVHTPLLGVAVVLMGAALALNRLSPGIALSVAWVGALVQLAAGAGPDAANLAILVVLYSTARHGSPVLRWVGLASAVLGAVIAAFYVSGPLGAGDQLSGQRFVVQLVGLLFAFLALMVLSWTLGLLARTWHTARETRRRELAAEQIVVVEQERNRIARDMHDVVAHSLAVVIAQADGARYAMAKDPKAADSALITISTTAREALADVRLLLGQLRHNEEAAPQPALADLDSLFTQLRASGLDLQVAQSGDASSFPPGQQLALYRIVQESLTNALRHGDVTEPVIVSLSWFADAATATITNATIAGASSGTAGHGLTGMRERAQLAGGSLETSLGAGNFVVHARIPMAS